MKIEDVRKKGYLAYPLPDNVREDLMEIFPPKHHRVVAHHITYKYGVLPSEINRVPAYLWSPEIRVIGYQDKEGVEVLVAEVNGLTTREDGKTYHITWSLEPGKRPMESNQILSSYGYEKLPSEKKYTFISTIQHF